MAEEPFANGGEARAVGLPVCQGDAEGAGAEEDGAQIDGQVGGNLGFVEKQLGERGPVAAGEEARGEPQRPVPGSKPVAESQKGADDTRDTS